MDIVRDILFLLHLIGFAALFGGCFVQMKSAEPQVNAAMLHGVITQLVTGILLTGLAEMGTDPVNHAKIGVKLLVTLVIAVLVIKNRKYESIPKGLWGILLGLSVLNAGVAVFW